MEKLISIYFLLLSASIFAQNLEIIESKYTYNTPENVSLEEAKRIALNRAIIQALADKFGTTISQTNITNINNSNGKTEIDFQSIGQSEVRGEWVETIGEPQYDTQYSHGFLIVTVFVKGKVRKIVGNKPNIEAYILKNGTQKQFESTSFRSGDEMYILFKSAADGYLAIYLLDDCDNSFCLLPYRNQSDGIYKVKANTDYVLFSQKHASEDEAHLVDEYILKSSKSIEYNDIYVIFSTFPFTKATDNSASNELPRELLKSDFNKWLAKCKTADMNINELRIPITIRK